MRNKKIIQLIFALVLIIGLGLSLFKPTKPFGFLLICTIEPIIGLYYLSLFRKEETNSNVEELALRYPLLLFIQLTFIGLVIQRLFWSMHWPFSGPVHVFVFALSCVTLVLGIIYVYLNRKHLQSIFVIEFVLIAMPVVLFAGMYTLKDYSEEYKDFLNKEYVDLNRIEYALYSQVIKDSTNDVSTVNTLEEIKKDMVMMSGGYNGDTKRLLGGLNSIYGDEHRFLRKLKNDSLSAIISKEPPVVIYYLTTMTKLQIDLLLKEQK